MKYDKNTMCQYDIGLKSSARTFTIQLPAQNVHFNFLKLKPKKYWTAWFPLYFWCAIPVENICFNIIIFFSYHGEKGKGPRVDIIKSENLSSFSATFEVLWDGFRLWLIRYSHDAMSYDSRLKNTTHGAVLLLTKNHPIQN